MTPQDLGFSRTSHQSNHLLQTPDSFVRAPLPGMRKATAVIHAGPALGACFTEYTAELEEGGTLGTTTAQRFLFVIGGEVQMNSETLKPGGFCFIPQEEAHSVTALKSSIILVIEKPYEGDGGSKPKALNGLISEIKPQPVMGDEGVLVQALMPAEQEFDFAVNILTFAPGAALSIVESHIMEHGLMMLEGGGIYKLGEHWYPTMAGDFIWMAPYCPQWFGAIGKTPAKYLLYKDWNRHPL